MTYLGQGEYFNADGDIVDNRAVLVAQLRAEVISYRMRDARERILREKNKTLQEAWEHYQTILRLVDDA